MNWYSFHIEWIIECGWFFKLLMSSTVSNIYTLPQVTPYHRINIWHVLLPIDQNMMKVTCSVQSIKCMFFILICNNQEKYRYDLVFPMHCWHILHTFIGVLKWDIYDWRRKYLTRCMQRDVCVYLYIGSNPSPSPPPWTSTCEIWQYLIFDLKIF
jgi:hypothetical protein